MAKSLTQREIEVLKLIGKGRTSLEMASELSVSINTIETHRKKLYNKLGMGRIVEVLNAAKNQGII